MRSTSIILEDYPLEQAMGIFRDAGFTSVEMWIHHLKRCTTPELRSKFVAYARSLGVGMGGLNVVGENYFQPFGADAEAEQTLNGLKADMEFALSLGTKDVLIWEGRAPVGTTEPDWLNRLLPRLIEILRAAIDMARPHGVRFLAEPHPFTVGMSDEFLIRLCDALDPAHFGVTFDFCHYGVGRKSDYIQPIYKLGHRIRHIHFSDSDLCTSELHFPVGRGRLNVQGILDAFREIGYAGTMALDLYGYPTPVEALHWSVPRFREAHEYLRINY